jgi:hypothetical protein
MKRALDGAAKASGRSQSQEAEVLLEQAFQNQKVLDALFGAHTSGLLLMIGGVMRDAMQKASKPGQPSEDLLEDIEVFDKVAGAVATLFAERRPVGSRVDEPAAAQQPAFSAKDVAEGIAVKRAADLERDARNDGGKSGKK